MAHKALTDRTLKALPKSKSGTHYDRWDGVVSGLGVRVSDTGRKTFVLLKRFPGKTHPTRLRIGEYSAVTLEKARQQARHWLELIQQGKHPSEEIERQKAEQARKRTNTFAAVAQDFIEQKLAGERRGPDAERDIKANFLPAWQALPIADITDDMVAALIKAKARTAPVQARNMLALAKRFFRWAIDQRAYGIRSNPAADLKPASLCGERISRERTLTDNELLALWRASGRMRYPFGPIYRLLLLTGLRLNEVADAEWSEFDFKAGLWTIPAARMKGRESKARAHIVPMTPEVRAILESLPRQNGGPFVFSTTAGKRPVWVSAKVKDKLDARMALTVKALARTSGQSDKPADWRNHDIRRTVRTHLSRLKISEEAREAVMAHVRPGIKGVYDLHDYLDEKREALTLWAARLRSIVEPAPANVVNLRAAR
jgi:integrase